MSWFRSVRVFWSRLVWSAIVMLAASLIMIAATTVVVMGFVGYFPAGTPEHTYPWTALLVGVLVLDSIFGVGFALFLKLSEIRNEDRYGQAPYVG